MIFNGIKMPLYCQICLEESPFGPLVIFLSHSESLVYVGGVSNFQPTGCVSSSDLLSICFMFLDLFHAKMAKGKTVAMIMMFMLWGFLPTVTHFIVLLQGRVI